VGFKFALLVVRAALGNVEVAGEIDLNRPALQIPYRRNRLLERVASREDRGRAQNDSISVWPTPRESEGPRHIVDLPKRATSMLARRALTDGRMLTQRDLWNKLCEREP